MAAVTLALILLTLAVLRSILRLAAVMLARKPEISVSCAVALAVHAEVTVLICELTYANMAVFAVTMAVLAPTTLACVLIIFKFAAVTPAVNALIKLELVVMLVWLVAIPANADINEISVYAKFVLTAAMA